MKIGSNPDSFKTKDNHPPLDLSPASSGESFLRPVEAIFKIWLGTNIFATLAWIFLCTNPYKAPAIVGVAILIFPALIFIMGLGNRLWAAFVCAATTSYSAFLIYSHYQL